MLSNKRSGGNKLSEEYLHRLKVHLKSSNEHKGCRCLCSSWLTLCSETHLCSLSRLDWYLSLEIRWNSSHKNKTKPRATRCQATAITFSFLLHESFIPRHSLLAVVAFSVTSASALSTDASPLKMVRLTSAWRTVEMIKWRHHTVDPPYLQVLLPRRVLFHSPVNAGELRWHILFHVYGRAVEGKSFLCRSSRVWAGC